MWSIYELDDSGEATGLVHFFCGYQCAEAFSLRHAPDTHTEPCLGWLVCDGCICETCGLLLDEE
jgi:hypothetical protein